MMIDIRRISTHHYDCLLNENHLGPCVVYSKQCIARTNKKTRCRFNATEPYSDMCAKHRRKYG
jgi:hypothetical protein